MKIEPKYNIGDNIRYVQREEHKIYETCPCCAGTGIMIGRDGNEYDCGECEGNKRVFYGKYNVIENAREGTVSSVHVHYDSNLCSKGGIGIVKIYYRTPHHNYNIDENDIFEKIITE